MRFDFTHFQALTSEEVRNIEHEVNRQVLNNYPVQQEYMTLSEAREKGALALFESSYGEKVRVINIGDGHSLELCGGTHLQATGEIGPFKILHEGE